MDLYKLIGICDNKDSYFTCLFSCTLYFANTHVTLSIVLRIFEQNQFKTNLFHDTLYLTFLTNFIIYNEKLKTGECHGFECTH